MSSILSFLKQKEKAESNGVQSQESSHNVETITAFAQSKNVSMAKAVEKLNSFQMFKIDQLLIQMTDKIKNINEEIAHKFEDGSILLNHAGRLSGLNHNESSLWKEGLYMKNDIQVSHTEALSEIIQIENSQKAPLPENKPSSGLRITL